MGDITLITSSGGTVVLYTLHSALSSLEIFTLRREGREENDHESLKCFFAETVTSQFQTFVEEISTAGEEMFCNNSQSFSSKSQETPKKPWI